MNTNILRGRFAPQPTFRDNALISNPQITLTADGTELTLYPADSSTPILRATLPEPPLCALDCGDTIIIMTETAPRFLYRSSGQWALLPAQSSDPTVTFRAVPSATVQAATASIVSSRGTSLTDGLQPGTTLQRKLTAALSEAYSSIIASAREGGYFLQPIIARCHFVDADGATVAISEPQLVALSSAQPWQMSSPVTTAVTKRSDTDFTIAPFTLSATPWSLHVDFPDLTAHPHYCRIAAAKILISEPIDFLDAKAQSPVRFSQTHGNSPGCTAAVPGATIGLSPITAHFNTRAAEVASSSTAYLASTLSPTVDTAKISYPDALLAYTIPRPLNFTAGCVTRSGSTIAWGNTRLTTTDSRLTTILTTSISDPLIPIGSTNITHNSSHITSLTPASRSQSTWDFSRTHLYAFSPEGTYALSFSAKGAYLSSALIDNRPALGPAVFTPHGVYCSVRGGLAIFTGSRAKDFIEMPEDIARLYYRADDDLILAEAATGTRYWITPAGEVCQIAPTPQFVYEYTFPTLTTYHAPLTLILPVLAQQIEASLTVCADSGAENGAAYPCATATFSGASLLPTVVRILAKPPRSRLHLRLAGTADPTLLISEPFLR